MADLLSAREAADICHVSERTIRNWISAGKVHAERTPAGFRIRSEDLPTPTETNAEPSGKSGNGAETSASLSDLVALVRELIPKAEAAAMWQARAELLAAQLEQVQKALPPGSPERPLERDSERAPSEPTGTPSVGLFARWWRGLFGTATG